MKNVKFVNRDSGDAAAGSHSRVSACYPPLSKKPCNVETVCKCRLQVEGYTDLILRRYTAYMTSECTDRALPVDAASGVHYWMCICPLFDFAPSNKRYGFIKQVSAIAANK